MQHRLPCGIQLQHRRALECDLRAAVESDLREAALQLDPLAALQLRAGRERLAGPAAVLCAGEARDRVVDLLLRASDSIRRIPFSQAAQPESQHHARRRCQRAGRPRPRGHAHHPARVGSAWRVRRFPLHLAGVVEKARGERHRANVEAAGVMGGGEHLLQPRALGAGDRAVDQRVAERVEFEQFVVGHAHVAPSSES